MCSIPAARLVLINSYCSIFGKVRVGLDLANLLNVSLGMGGDFEHPLPAVDGLSCSEAMGAQVVVGGFDVFDHGRAQRLELGQGLSEVFVRVDPLMSAARFGMHNAIN